MDIFFSVCGVTDNSQKQHYTGLISLYNNKETRTIKLTEPLGSPRNVGHIPLKSFIDVDILDKILLQILEFFGIPPCAVSYMQTAYKPLNTITETVTMLLYIPHNIDEQIGQDVLMLLKYALYSPKK
jgi:hypothetical protein